MRSSLPFPILAVLAGTAFLAGCATSGADTAAAGEQALQSQVSELTRNLEERDRELQRTSSELRRMSQELEQSRDAGFSSQRPGGFVGAELLPPNAKPGECYARAYLPATYRTETERVLRRQASERLEIIPARYEMAEERVLVRDASTRLEEVPAEYGWEEERVLIKPAHTVWKKGRGPIERIDEATGEIMCLIEVPAEYKTVRKRVLRRPTTTREIQIPAEYRTVKVRKMVEPPREKRIPIPEEWETVTKRAQVSDGRIEWRPVLCETNATAGVVANIQRALRSAGHDPGPIDGVIGSQTLAAVRSFQSQKNLPSGGLNYETIAALGVKVGR
jgi:outer membrane murein-binding lipoprotein Lpp